MKNIIVISDTHFGCRLGLYPSNMKIPLDLGGYYVASGLQRKMWKMWTYFWDEWVPQVTKGEPYIIVHNGDIIDGMHHQNATHITANIDDQFEIAEKVMKPIIERAERFYSIRGTEAHVGKSAQNENRIAKILGAVPDEYGSHSRYEMWYDLCDSLIHFSHHCSHTSSTAYESTGIWKELVEAYNEAGRWYQRPPDVVVRSHRHRQFEIRIASKRGYAIVLVTPCWQLHTPFVYTKPSGRAGLPQLGGYLIRHGDEDVIYTRFKVWRIQKSKVVNERTG